MAATPILADQADDQQVEETTDLERIQVTGSRIRRETYEAPSPVTVLSREEIERSEFQTLGDIMAQLPQLNSTFTSQNSSQFIGTAGEGRLDLRGLGTERTLVLVNGRRHVAANIGGGQQVDVNSIPAEMIERVEVVTGANSAVQGADAVAGAINFILRDDYEGTSINATYGFAEHATDFERRSVSLTHGLTFAGGRGSAIFSMSYADQSALTNADRGGRFLESWSIVPNPNAPRDSDGVAVGSADEPIEFLQPFRRFHSIAFGGAIIGLGDSNGPFGSTVFIDDNGNPVPVDFDAMQFINGTTCAGQGCEFGTDSFDDFDIMQVPVKRWNFDANFKRELGNNHTLYSENRFARVKGSDIFQPSFDFAVGPDPTGSFLTGALPIHRDNPFVSDELGEMMDEAGVDTVGMNRLNRDLGLRLEEDTRTTFRHVLGVEGLFDGPSDSAWEYDVFANFGRSEVKRINQNNRINNRWFAAVDAVELSADDIANIQDSTLFVGANPQAGDIVCRSTLQAAMGETPILSNGEAADSSVYNQCVPANVFGENVSPASADYVNSTAVATGKRDQYQVGATIANQDWLRNWAGDIPFVFGAEFRRESLKVEEDSLSATGATFFNSLGAIDADFDVTEFFGEFAFPLVRGVRGIEDLTFEAAGRWSDYSTIGSTFTWETRLQYTPIDSLTFRATRGEALRAPDLGDLFTPPTQSFSNVDHPCDVDSLPDAPDRNVRISNCQALGIDDPANFIANDDASFELLVGGNPDLNEEEANSWTVGAVWSPDFVSGLDLSVDYWDIEITDAIAAPGTQDILNRCVDDTGGIDNQFCGLIDFLPDGNISLIRPSSVNLNEFINRGVDFAADYNRSLWGGNLRTTLVGQYLIERKEILNTDNDIDFLAGELGDPEWRINLDTSWQANGWELFSRVRWLSSVFLVDKRVRQAQPFLRNAQDLEAGSAYYVDLGVGYTTDFGLRGRVSINNAFDRDIPFLNSVGTSQGSALYDNVGRFYNFQIGYDF